MEFGQLGFVFGRIADLQASDQMDLGEVCGETIPVLTVSLAQNPEVDLAICQSSSTLLLWN